MSDEPDPMFADLAKPARPPEPVAAATPEAEFNYERESFAWATDVFFVYEHLGDSAAKAKKFPATRKALHAHAKENMEHFLGQLLPKAMQLLEKGREKQGDELSVVVEERKGIAELERILSAALKESGVIV